MGVTRALRLVCGAANAETYEFPASCRAAACRQPSRLSRAPRDGRRRAPALHGTGACGPGDMFGLLPKLDPQADETARWTASPNAPPVGVTAARAQLARRRR